MVAISQVFLYEFNYSYRSLRATPSLPFKESRRTQKSNSRLHPS